MNMDLRPSKIRFCQDSINDVFDRNSGHSNKKIGETLDALLRGQCNISDIPPITVVDRDGVWFTVDNRRLWVFRKLEEMGKCTEIRVKKGEEIPSRKLTTGNGGVSVRVRGDAGGSFWKGEPIASSNENITGSAATTESQSSVYRPYRYRRRRRRWWHHWY